MPGDTRMRTHGRVGMVTGGSRGLGWALVERLVEDGWRVIVDARDERRLRAAVAALGGPEQVAAIAGDVADPEHRGDLVEAAAAHGGLDLLVNNASLLGPSPMPELADLPIAALRQVLEANVLAPLALMQLAAPLLDTRDGRVINISSDAGVEAYPGWGGYGASKAALDHVTSVWTAEHPARRVYAFDPGDMATEMHQAAFPGEDISDRPAPAEVVPQLVRLVHGDLPNGRYRAVDLRVGAPA